MSGREKENALSTCPEAKPDVNRVPLVESWGGGLLQDRYIIHWDGLSVSLSTYRGTRFPFHSTVSTFDLPGHPVPETPRIITHLPVTR